MGNLRSTRAKQYLRPYQHTQNDEFTSGKLSQQRPWCSALELSKLVAMTGHGGIIHGFYQKEEKIKGGDKFVMA